MLIYAGIDEAGYGPMLGPLCVAGAAFILDQHDLNAGHPDLWDLLSGAVCRPKRDGRHRIAVDDSKKLKGSNSGKMHPLHHLERGVLTFLNQLHDEFPANDASLFDLLKVETPTEDWYGSITNLPVAHSPDELGIAANRLRRTCSKEGIKPVLMQCEAIDAGRFNEQVTRMGNKAAVNFAAAMRIAETIRQTWPDAHPRIVIDRHGGRTHYREPLQMTWPEATIRILAEEESFSRYRLDDGGRLMTITFARQADAQHFPVALASMTAKYIRELMMLRLNRHFQNHLAELKPTAGYVQDGRRYLRDITPLLQTQKIDRSRLIRNC